MPPALRFVFFLPNCQLHARLLRWICCGMAWILAASMTWKSVKTPPSSHTFPLPCLVIHAVAATFPSIQRAPSLEPCSARKGCFLHSTFSQPHTPRQHLKLAAHLPCRNHTSLANPGDHFRRRHHWPASPPVMPRNALAERPDQALVSVATLGSPRPSTKHASLLATGVPSRGRDFP